jgi:predicted MPP superfamily phosphohydrolase
MAPWRLRVAHLTDLHFQLTPSFRELSFKRLVSSVHLHVLGRAKRFSLAAQREVIRAAAATLPDVVVVTGDLTAQGLRGELELARRELSCLLDRVPCLVIPGNHDIYTRQCVRERTFEAVFSPWMHAAGEQSPRPQSNLRDRSHGLYRLAHGPIDIVGLNPCRPTLFGAAGKYSEAEVRTLTHGDSPPRMA